MIGILIALLVFSFIVRIAGIGYGLPSNYITDESDLVGGALKMGEAKTLCPPSFKYPSLMIYLNFLAFGMYFITGLFIGKFHSLLDFKKYAFENVEVFYLMARFITVLFGVATIYMVYLIGKNLFQKKTAIASAFFLSFSLLHIIFSHQARPWIPCIFFLVIGFYFTINIYKRGRLKDYLLCGLFIGLATSTLYNGIIGISFLLSAYFLSIQPKRIKRLILCFGMILLGFIMTSPYFLLSLSQLKELAKAGTPIRDIKETFSNPLLNPLEIFENSLFYLRNLFLCETIIFLYAIGGSFLLLFKDKRKASLLLSFIVSYIFILCICPTAIVTRWLVILTPFMAVLAGYFFTQIKTKLIKTFSIIPILLTIKYLLFITASDTRNLAKAWLEDNLPENVKIIVDSYGVELYPTKAAILYQKRIAPHSMSAKDKYLLSLKEKDYPKPAFNILRVWWLDEDTNFKELFLKEKFSYAVLAKFNFKKNIEFYQNFYTAVSENYKIIKQFSPDTNLISQDIVNSPDNLIINLFKFKRPGPLIEIYKNKTKLN